MKKYDVFISYSSLDKKVVEGLCAYLEQHKIRCFVAYRDIPVCEPWPTHITEALSESQMMVVVFSKNFNHSKEVDRELTIASKKKMPILTFRLSDEEFKELVGVGAKVDSSLDEFEFDSEGDDDFFSEE